MLICWTKKLIIVNKSLKITQTTNRSNEHVGTYSIWKALRSLNPDTWMWYKHTDWDFIPLFKATTPQKNTFPRALNKSMNIKMKTWDCIWKKDVNALNLLSDDQQRAATVAVKSCLIGWNVYETLPDIANLRKCCSGDFMLCVHLLYTVHVVWVRRPCGLRYVTQHL